MRLIDLTGRAFGVLLVQRMSRYVLRPNGKVYPHWICSCQCGSEIEASGDNLRTGHTKSCGCMKTALVAASKTVHGEAKREHRSREYTSWRSMISRCYNPKQKGFKYWGGRGIEVCSRWRFSFEAFLEDMGRKPSSKHTIDRINNEEGYTASNCRWATYLQQRRNRRDYVERHGVAA